MRDPASLLVHNLPGYIGHLRQEEALRASHAAAGAVRHLQRVEHAPQVGGTGGGIAPENTRDAATLDQAVVNPARPVVIAYSNDVPVEIGYGGQIGLRRKDGQSVHRIDVVFTGRSVAPDDIPLVVLVEVAKPFHLP